MQYSNEKPADKITLFVYGGKDGSFKLYEDEGDNYNYEKGKYAAIEFTYNELSKTLVIGDRKGEFNGMLKNRTFNVVYVNQANPKAFDLKVRGRR